jgi:hypothetical protein
MKNKITTPGGIRVDLDKIDTYKPDEAKDVPKLLVFFSGDGEATKFLFDTTEERDAFLARLDAYFQEIP